MKLENMLNKNEQRPVIEVVQVTQEEKKEYSYQGVVNNTQYIVPIFTESEIKPVMEMYQELISKDYADNIPVMFMRCFSNIPMEIIEEAYINTDSTNLSTDENTQKIDKLKEELFPFLSMYRELWRIIKEEYNKAYDNAKKKYEEKYNTNTI